MAIHQSREHIIRDPPPRQKNTERKTPASSKNTVYEVMSSSLVVDPALSWDFRQ
jgi:hypothetical protein